MADNKKAGIFAAVSVTFAVATLSIFLRLMARRMTRVPILWDDWYVIVAWIFAIGWNSVVLRWVYDGLGQRLVDIPHLTLEAAAFRSKLLLYIAELLYAASLAFSKFAILSFFWRMFKTSNIRWPIRILFVGSVVWLLIRTVLAVFHCWPIQAFWDDRVQNATCPINDSKFCFGSVLAHLVIDMAILALPVLQVQQLQLARGQKVAVVGLFMFGILVCIASVIVLVESVKFDPHSVEMPYNITNIMIWATVEVNLAIVSACLPMLRPIFRRIVPGSFLGSHRQSQHISRRELEGAMKLTTIGRSREEDESSSTCDLADPNNGKPLAMKPEDDNHAIDAIIGHHTTISSRDTDLPPSRDGFTSNPSRPGIIVKKEMTVQYSERA